MKSYIYQLSGGRMLVFQDGWVAIETTGYPLPDCSLQLGDKVLHKQSDIMRAVLGYDIEDSKQFAVTLCDIKPMKFSEFKHMCIMQNIGGGCSDRVKAVEAAVFNGRLSKNLALFMYTLPSSVVDTSCVLPNDEDVAKEYGDLLNISWVSHVNTPNWKFRNNLIMFTGCREVTDKHVEYIKDVVSICMRQSEKVKYHYLCGITLSNGNGALVLTDSYIGDADLCYLYQRVTGCDLSVGKIVGDVNTDGSFTVKFEYVESGTKKRRMPEVSGVVTRYHLW